MRERGVSSGFYARSIKLHVSAPGDYPLQPYQRRVDLLLSPLKHKLSIYSDRKQKPGRELVCPETIYMTAKDADDLDRIYEQVKRGTGQGLSPNKGRYVHDPLYKTFYKNKQLAAQARYNRTARGDKFPELGKLRSSSML